MGDKRRAFGLMGVLSMFAAAALWGTTTSANSALGIHPAVTGASLHHGNTRGGTRVIVRGHGFEHVRWVEFGTKRGRIIRVTGGDRIVVRSPAHQPGLVDMRVRTAAGTSGRRKADKFRYLSAPVQLVVGNSGGQTFACARTAVGAAECWGDGSGGVLGNGSDGNSAKPVKVKGMASGVRDLSAGVQAACAVTSAGAAKCWGWESFGALGNGVDDLNAHTSTPSQVVGLTSGVRSVTAGNGFSCAVTASRGVACWGNDGAGQLGSNGPTGTHSAVPVAIAGISGVASVVTGGEFACALTTVGAVECWGADNEGQLGDGGSETFSPSPVAVHGLSSGVRSLAAGGATACAVTGAEAAKCWGSNSYGELGNPNVGAMSNVPVQVKGLGSGQASIAVGGGNSACAVSTGGAVKCWGYNYDGQLGNGTETDSGIPVKVRGLSSGVKTESQSTYTGCALTSTARVRCWGYVPIAPSLTDIPISLPWFE